jgi:hypothetical protein
MNEHELGRRLAMLQDSVHQLSDRLRQMEMVEEPRKRLLVFLKRQIHEIERLLRKILRQQGKETAPVPGTLTVTFHPTGAPMNAILVATLPTSRGDSTPLAPTDIASITFQKTQLGADGVTPGPQVSLQVNDAAAGAGLQLTDTTFTDTNSIAGDAYTFFVTDTAGDAGAVSNVVTNPGTVATKPSAPAAGTLAATFN